MKTQTEYPLPSRKIAALKELGETKVMLDDGPLEKATSFEPGGLHRISICVSGWFKFSEDGIEYSWSFDLENRDANGKGAYAIDVDRVRETFRKLRGEARLQFRTYLATSAAAVRKHGNEIMTAAEKQLSDAAILRDLSLTK